MKICIFTLALLLAGCITQPSIEVVEQWEGHYYTVEDFQKGTQYIMLSKGQSVWVLSDRTLARVMKKCAQLSEGK